jgi:putative DNA primase/helicase
MIQILGIRHNFDEKIGTYKSTHAFFNNRWRAESVPDLFTNLEKLMGVIPHDERWNLFYTTALCEEIPGVKMIQQTTIPIDIDGIDCTQIDKYHPLVLKCLGGLKFDEVGIVCSGNGLQYLIETDVAITDKEYFNYSRPLYATLCEIINQTLDEAELLGQTDPSVWSPARLMRLPNTTNKKTPETGYGNKNLIKEAYLIQKNIVVQPNFTLESLLKIPTMAPGEQLADQQLSRYPAPDTKAVLEGCDFLKYCHDNQDRVQEPAWYAMLTITSRLENGVDLSHQYSADHPGYSYRDTAIKINQALKYAGPRTCKNISTLWSGCQQCPNYQKVISPITIRSPDYIRTQATGFYDQVFDEKTGLLKKTKPNFDDLRKFFNLQYEYVTDDNAQIFIYNGKHWEIMKDIHPQRFCEEHFDPKPTRAMASEFLHKIHRTNGRLEAFFTSSTAGMINLQNGILDLNGTQARLLPHDPDKAFMYVAEYQYDPDAKAPRFERFMKEVTMGDETMHNLLMEFIAYALTDVHCAEQKALILLGEGSNGKSTLIDVIKILAGGDTAYSILNLNQLADTQQAADLQGKLFNLCEETPSDSFMESSHFKNIVSGGEINVKVVYKPPFKIKNRAKLIVSANRMPKTKDNTHGMLRRFIIIPFDARFSGKAIDKELGLKLRTEMPGILNLVIEAYYRYKKQRGFTDVVRAKKALDEYKNDSGLDGFFDDVIVQTESKDDFLITNEVYALYLKHCDENFNKFPINNVHFGRALNSYLREKYYVNKTLESIARYVKGKKARGYEFFSCATHCTPF